MQEYSQVPTKRSASNLDQDQPEWDRTWIISQCKSEPNSGTLTRPLRTFLPPNVTLLDMGLTKQDRASTASTWLDTMDRASTATTWQDMMDRASTATTWQDMMDRPTATTWMDMGLTRQDRAPTASSWLAIVDRASTATTWLDFDFAMQDRASTASTWLDMMESASTPATWLYMDRISTATTRLDMDMDMLATMMTIVYALEGSPVHLLVHAPGLTEIALMNPSS